MVFGICGALIRNQSISAADIVAHVVSAGGLAGQDLLDDADAHDKLGGRPSDTINHVTELRLCRCGE